MTRGIPRAARLLTVLLPVFLLTASQAALGQDGLPDAPSVAPRSVAHGCAPGAQTPKLGDCDASVDPDSTPSAAPLFRPEEQAALPASPCLQNSSNLAGRSICCEPSAGPFQRFLRASANHSLTPRGKLLLAGKHAVDPFNLLTILGTSAISTASDPDSAYGPGMKGFARNSGVVFTEGLTSEFFGTFLIPSLTGQDPHYHRMPNASTGRRVAHAFYQVVWTQSDAGRPMFNYATVVGTVAEDAVNDLYVPGRKLGVGASAIRIGTAIATDPIDNIITEFVPDIARHVSFHVVFVQRIINQVAQEESRTASD